jgi:hypothetical protein
MVQWTTVLFIYLLKKRRDMRKPKQGQAMAIIAAFSIRLAIFG